MTAEIHIFNGVTTLDLPPDRILEAAVGKLSGVLVVGWKEDGTFYGATSYADGGDCLWLLELCKKRLLEAGGA